jgi:hypothetical protein
MAGRLQATPGESIRSVRDSNAFGRNARSTSAIISLRNRPPFQAAQLMHSSSCGTTMEPLCYGSRLAGPPFGVTLARSGWRYFGSVPAQFCYGVRRSGNYYRGGESE